MFSIHRFFNSAEPMHCQQIDGVKLISLFGLGVFPGL